MTHLHVKLPDHQKWTLITDEEHFSRFENLMLELSESVDIARRDISRTLVGRFYAKYRSGSEFEYLLRDDGTLTFSHLEAMLDEDQYEFLLSILQEAKPAESEDDQP